MTTTTTTMMEILYRSTRSRRLQIAPSNVLMSPSVIFKTLDKSPSHTQMMLTLDEKMMPCPSLALVMMEILFNQVATPADCAKQCADEPQCHGWGHFAPAKRYNGGDDKIMMMKLGCG